MKNINILSFKRIIKAAQYSFAGIKAAVKYEAAFCQELIICILLTPIGFYICQKPLDYLLCFGSLLSLLLVELINSAIESVVNRFGDEWHELAGRAKDMGSAAVALALIIVAMCWWVVLRQ